MKGNLLEVSGVHFWDSFLNVLDCGIKQTGWAVACENLKKLIQSETKFDVVIMELIYGDVLLGLGHHFNAPVIATSTFGAYKWTTDFVASPIFPSYIPNTNNGFTDRMTFWQRMYNSMSYWFDDIVMPLVSTPKQQQYLDELFPSAMDMPTIDELKRNVSLVLLNTHLTVGTARPYAPNMIEVGGMHIERNVEPLPKYIQTFLDEAEHGVIYLALGSCIQFSKLTNDKKNAIINAFSEHSRMRIIIKSEENVVIPSHKIKDVLVESWFLQQSILAHSAVKMFVTHGGMLSTLEAVHFAKPLVGIPIVFDEYLNLAVAQQYGYGISVPFQRVTQHTLRLAFRDVLSNARCVDTDSFPFSLLMNFSFFDSSYTENAKIACDRYRDRLRPPLETAIHWVKHVAKNKGAPQMRMVAVDLPFYVLYNLDVWAFVLCFVCATLWILKSILKFLVSSIYSTFKLKSKQN